jgi:hypothetical protein
MQFLLSEQKRGVTLFKRLPENFLVEVGSHPARVARSARYKLTSLPLKSKVVQEVSSLYAATCSCQGSNMASPKKSGSLNNESWSGVSDRIDGWWNQISTARF